MTYLTIEVTPTSAEMNEVTPHRSITLQVDQSIQVEGRAVVQTAEFELPDAEFDPVF